MSVRPRIIVSIVNWNTREALERCLRALGRETGAELDVVVVDNASTDGSAAMVAARFPAVRLITNEHNEGFAAANNRVLGQGEPDAFLVLNPDVEVRPGVLPALARFLEATPDAAAVAPLLVGADGAPHTHLYRRFPSAAQIVLSWTLLGLLTQRVGWLRRRIAEHDLRGTRPVRVDQIPGAAMLIRPAALHAIGPMDPGYFIWFEDVDWCYRARLAGRALYVLPAETMAHEGGASFRRWTTQTRVFQFHRAFFRFLCKHRLEGLLRLAQPVLTVDLLLKEWILRLRRAAGGAAADDVRTLAPTRRAIRDVVQRHRAGELVDFDSAQEPAATAATRIDRPGAPTLDGTGDAGVAAVIVNWNGRRYLGRAIEALSRSTVPVHVIVVDNASTDGSVEHVRTMYPGVEVLEAGSNVGYAAGANLGLRAVRARYALVMNPDVMVEPDHIERLRDRLESEPGIGAAQGKLFRISPDEFDAGTPPRAVIDSAGHVIRRSRMVVDRGQGEPDGPEYDREAAIFSACGAALFLRMSMLRDLAPDARFFAEEFFAYKEDIDLCWRARVLGWEVRYVPSAVAHHVRALPLGGSAWRAMSPAARRHSWKNHYLLILRNDTAPDLLRAAPFLAGWALLRLGHALLRDPRLLPAYVQLAREARPALRARRELFARRRVGRTELARWFGAAAKPVDGSPEIAHRSRMATP